MFVSMKISIDFNNISFDRLSQVLNADASFHLDDDYGYPTHVDWQTRDEYDMLNGGYSHYPDEYNNIHIYDCFSIELSSGLKSVLISIGVEYTVYDYELKRDVYFLGAQVLTADIANHSLARSGQLVFGYDETSISHIDVAFGSDFNDDFRLGRNDDYAEGGGGNDRMDGGSGADELFGNRGNDTFYVDNVRDKVFEAASEGGDTVYSSVSYALGAGQHIELLATTKLTGAGAINLTGNELAQRINGNNGANVINGGGGDDLLVGYDGNDWLTGGAGADQMNGGLGNDVFYVDHARDEVFEAASGGADIAYSSIGYTLATGVHVETLATTKLTGTGAINLTGNELAQRINGNNGANVINGGGGNDLLVGYGGNDRLTGGAGVDRMNGGLGNDVFYVDNARDEVLEAASGGADTVYTAVSYAMAAGQHVETLATTVQAGTGAINLTGNELAQRINGNNGANTIIGGGGNDALFGLAGNDILAGGLGNDVLTGGAGKDHFVFNTVLSAKANVDRITDFNIADDTILLDNAVMAGLGASLGTLSPGKYWSSPSGIAHDADDRIIYETDTGKLFYDANGHAAGGSIHIATLATNLKLTAPDFQVI